MFASLITVPDFHYLGVIEDLQSARSGVEWSKLDVEYNAIEQVFSEPPPGGWHKGLEHRAYHIISVTRSTPSPKSRARQRTDA